MIFGHSDWFDDSRTPAVEGRNDIIVRAGRWLGGGTHPLDGSGETLLRGVYDFNAPYREST